MRLVSYLLLLAVIVSGCQKKEDAKPPSPGGSTHLATLHSSSSLFEKITTRSGVQFVRQGGTNYSMPDQIGSGVVLFDFNQDGNIDLYLVQKAVASETQSSPASRTEPINRPAPPTPSPIGWERAGVREGRAHGEEPGNQLFQGQGDGTFKNVSANSGLEAKGEGMAAIAGDINNDGFPDVVLTEYDATRVFQNLGNGKFQEVGAASGIDNPRWAAPASFIDFDRDGWLDLVAGNYADYDPTRICHDQQGRREFCGPSLFPPVPARLWRNITAIPGDAPKFEDWSVRSGIVKAQGMALGLVCADFTGDQWPDIFCADDGRPNRLFVNQQNGTFKEEAALRGLGYDAMGRTAANMGVAFADFSGDGWADLFITHLTEEFHSYFKQEQPGYFFDVVSASGLQQQAWRGTGFGAVAADFDLDGWTDLAFVNGMVRRGGAAPPQPLAQGVHPWWAQYAQRHQIFLNKNGQFVDVSEANPAFCGEASVGRSLAVGDLDNDGALDLVAGNTGSPVEIYRNVSASRGHWLKVRLLEPQRGGRDAIGAEISFGAGNRIWRQTLQPATSYLASNDPTLHFGLGQVGRIDSAEVVWASGEVERFSIGDVNRTVILKKGSGQPVVPK